MVCDMPELCKFPFLDSCQKRFLLTYKEVDLALHPVIGLALGFAWMALFMLQPNFRIQISWKATKNVFDVHFECDFSSFRIQTFNWSHPWCEKPGSFSESRLAGPFYTAIEEDGGDKRLVQLELARKGNGVALLYPIESGHCSHC